eukprot:scaffold21581_cov101-Isochrysis_galbana.AAC.1
MSRQVVAWPGIKKHAGSEMVAEKSAYARTATATDAAKTAPARTTRDGSSVLSLSAAVAGVVWAGRGEVVAAGKDAGAQPERGQGRITSSTPPKQRRIARQSAAHSSSPNSSRAKMAAQTGDVM